MSVFFGLATCEQILFSHQNNRLSDNQGYFAVRKLGDRLARYKKRCIHVCTCVRLSMCATVCPCHCDYISAHVKHVCTPGRTQDILSLSLSSFPGGA
jgi:hypothetical protein